MSADEEITLCAFTIEYTTIENVSAQEHAGVKAADAVGDEYDVYLSDMDGITFMVEPDGSILFPYEELDSEGATGMVMRHVWPILDALPPELLYAYLAEREVNGREGKS